jgi:aminobenzoyl-glutamate utilization protein B
MSSSNTQKLKTTAAAWIDRNKNSLSRWHSNIWELAEPAWREYESCAWYVKTLREHGFTVDEGSGGMPTAFAAEWTSPAGSGPRILSYAEYDAIPGNSQAASTKREPRRGMSRFAPGHTDPHSALGISTLAGFLAAKESMIEHSIQGTLVYMGEPAEKVQGSKVVHGLHGYYDNVDAIISYHPFYMLPLCNTSRWDTHCGSYYSKIYTFTCDNPEGWNNTYGDSPIPSSHSAARAPGADAALFTMFSLTKTTQDSMLPHAGGWSLSEAILTAGQATADNQPAGLAQIQYSWRCASIPEADSVLAVLDRNAELAAEASHCTASSRWVARNRPGIANHTVAQLAWENIAAIGAPILDERAREIGREIQKSCGVEPMDNPFHPATAAIISPQKAEAELRRHVPSTQQNWTSDDYVEMTWYAPTIRFYTARPTLTPPPNGKPYPGWAMTALGGIPETIDPTIQTTGKMIAGMVLDLLTSPLVLAKAKEEFEAEKTRRGAIPPLLPVDFTAPTDFRWPSYTGHGADRDWWIPVSEEPWNAAVDGGC